MLDEHVLSEQLGVVLFEGSLPVGEADCLFLNGLNLVLLRRFTVTNHMVGVQAGYTWHPYGLQHILLFLIFE